MRLVNELPPNEKFVFEPYGELLTTSEKLPKEYPEVVVLNVAALITVAEAQTGEIVIKGTGKQGHGIVLRPGDQLHGVMADDDYDPTHSYAAGTGDKLIFCCHPQFPALCTLLLLALLS